MLKQPGTKMKLLPATSHRWSLMVELSGARRFFALKSTPSVGITTLANLETYALSKIVNSN